MQAALDHFDSNLSRARGLVQVERSISRLTTSAVDTSDILRAALVLGASALDHYVHELVRLGMREVHRGVRSTTQAHLAFKITLDTARLAFLNPSQDDWLDDAVRDAHGWQTFQQPDKIAQAVALISSVSLWDDVGAELGIPKKKVTAELKAIVDRRNKIAHEADMDPTNPGSRWPISAKDVEDALDFLARVAQAIHKTV